MTVDYQQFNKLPLMASAAYALQAMMSFSGRSHRRKKTKEPDYPLAKTRYVAKPHYRHPNERQRIINKMTNWQRNQAGKYCRGKWDLMDLDRLEYFANLERPNAKIQKEHMQS